MSKYATVADVERIVTRQVKKSNVDMSKVITDMELHILLEFEPLRQSIEELRVFDRDHSKSILKLESVNNMILDTLLDTLNRKRPAQ